MHLVNIFLEITAKLIHHVEAKFGEDLIAKWVESERIIPEHKEIFMVLTLSSDTKLKHGMKESEKVEKL